MQIAQYAKISIQAKSETGILCAAEDDSGIRGLRGRRRAVIGRVDAVVCRTSTRRCDQGLGSQGRDLRATHLGSVLDPWRDPYGGAWHRHGGRCCTGGPTGTTKTPVQPHRRHGHPSAQHRIQSRSRGAGRALYHYLRAPREVERHVEAGERLAAGLALDRGDQVLEPHVLRAPRPPVPDADHAAVHGRLALADYEDEPYPLALGIAYALAERLGPVVDVDSHPPVPDAPGQRDRVLLELGAYGYDAHLRRREPERQLGL